MKRLQAAYGAFASLSLRGRLLLVLVLLGIIPLLGLILYTASEQRRQLAATGVQDAVSVARLVNKHQENLIEGVRETLVALAQLPELRGSDPAACAALLADLLQQYPRYDNLGVAEPDGTILCSARPSRGSVEEADRPWFERALQMHDLAIGEYHVGRITGRATLNFGYPIFGEGRRDARRVAFAGLDLTWLTYLAAQAPLPEGAVFVVIDRGGTILAHYPEPERWIGHPLPETALLNAIQSLRPCGAEPPTAGERVPRAGPCGAPFPVEGTAEATDTDGVVRLYAFSPLGGVPEAGVYSIVGIPKAAALAEADRLLTRNLIGLAMVGMAVLIAVWAGGDLSIARPVNTLLRATRRLAGGDLRARTGLRSDRGELGQLAYAFDQMAEALEVRTTELRRANERLAEQTAALAADLEERKRIEEQLLRAQRLEAVGLLAAQVAHDFNNLLGPLVALPDLIKAQLPTGDEAGEMCDTMLQAAQQMRDICEDLRMLSPGGHSNREPLDLNLVVEQAVAHMARPSATLEVELDLAQDLLPVSGSEAQLVRVVTNLLNNAREAMQEHGCLAVRTVTVYLDQPLGRYTRVEAGEYVRVDVSDTGPGIPPEILDRIFDPFFTTKRTRRLRGSGLGLSIVQRIVSDHRGYVDVHTEQGEGTTFSIYLPTCREPLREAETTEIRGGTESILVVDDDPLQCETIGHMLRRLGYRVDTVPSGEEGVAHMRQHPADLVILDMVMPPGIDGCETYRRLLDVRPRQRAVIVSGFAASERVKEVQALGAGPFLRKPLRLDRLARAVRAELEK